MPRQKAQVSENPSETTALALVTALQPKGRESNRAPKTPGPRDRRRWFLFAGKQMPIEEIANREGVTPLAIQNSIDLMKEYRHRNSNESVILKVNEVFINHLEGVSKVFGRGLNAKKSVPAGTTKTGKTRYKDVPDVSMQLKTVASLKNLQELAQPKAPLVQSNTQFNTNVNSGGPGEYQSGMSFESRLRMIREKRGLKNEEEIADVEDGEIVGEDTVEDELRDIGIDLDEAEGEEGDGADADTP